MSLINKFSNVWNAFVNAANMQPTNYGYASSTRPDSRPNSTQLKARGLIDPVYNRIANDCASIKIHHIVIDEESEQYLFTVHDALDERLNVSANIDQTGRQFIRDLIFQMLDEGIIAVCPYEVDDNIDPNDHDAYDILSWRVAVIKEWAPGHVLVSLYDEEDGQYKDVWYNKKAVSIIESPLFQTLNASNSLAQRLLSKMAIMDKIDSDNASSKLDMIIQLPYGVKSASKMKIAEERRANLAEQLKNSELGIAYIDSTEKIIQLNRPIGNNLVDQIAMLKTELYDTLCITPEIMNGTATAEQMSNYMTRMVAICLDAVVDELQRKFLTRNAYSRGHRLKYFIDYFKIMPVEKFADTADKLTRNAILSSNEVRQELGFKPVQTEDANALRNKNLNVDDNLTPDMMPPPQDGTMMEGMPQNGEPLPEEVMYPSETAPTSEPQLPEEVLYPSEQANDGYTDDDIGFH